MFLLYSSQKDSYIKFQEIEREKEHYPSIKLEINFQMKRLSGEKIEAEKITTWIDLEALKAFEQDLQKIYSENRGVSSLKSLSPDEFSLEIKTMDALGHLMLNIELNKRFSAENFPCIYQVKGGFEIEQSSLLDLINYLQKFYKK